MRIATCNVNGLRAAAVKGMAAWKEAVNADVLLLQEVRAPESLIEGLIGPGYHVFSRACDIKGRAGVTVAVRESMRLARCASASPNQTGWKNHWWILADGLKWSFPNTQ